jgi:Mn-dependent DtxR family transcriptional regulator
MGGPQRRANLIAASGRTDTAIAQALTTMRHRGLVKRVQHGHWTLTEAGHTAAAKLGG